MISRREFFGKSALGLLALSGVGEVKSIAWGSLNKEDQWSLFQRFPALAEGLPRIPLAKLPTPIHRMKNLERSLNGGELWVKRDDSSSPDYGGNKPRKLELILARAKEGGAQTLITFGGLGTNHGLATAIFGKKLGFKVILVLTPQPVNDFVIRNLFLMKQFGAEIFPTKGPLYAALKTVRTLLRGNRHFMIPPGGSSALGTLGFVNAAFELKNQISSGETPEPDYIFLPLGSCGTATGLALGLKMAGLSSRVIAVRVYDRIASNYLTMRTLAKRTMALLMKIHPDIPPARLSANDFSIVHDFFGDGYGAPTKEGEQAMKMANELEGLKLDPTYSGKAMAGFIDFVKKGNARGKRLLFWNTYNSITMDKFLQGRTIEQMAGAIGGIALY